MMISHFPSEELLVPEEWYIIPEEWYIMGVLLWRVACMILRASRY